MPSRFAVLRHASPAVLAAACTALQPERAWVRGGVALLAWQGGHETADGRAAGVLHGVVFDDLAVAARLIARGLAADPHRHEALAIDSVALGGPQGLAGLRWQGSLAVLHQGQRQAIVARDLLGVGPLWHRALDGGEVLASTPDLAAAVPGGVGPVAPVPAGQSALVGERGTQWQAQRPAPENRPWFREIPDELRHAGPAEVEAGLAVRIAAAAAAAARALGGLERPAGQTAAGRWLDAQVPCPGAAAAAAAGGLWTLAGAEALFGELAPPEGWTPAPPPPGLPAVEPAEPVDRVPAAERRQRWLRVTWLADEVLPAEHARAAAQGRTLVAPHLDPAVLAWLGGARAESRPLLSPAPPSA